MIQNSLNYAIKSRPKPPNDSNFETSTKINNWCQNNRNRCALQAFRVWKLLSSFCDGRRRLQSDFGAFCMPNANRKLHRALQSFCATLRVIIAGWVATRRALNLKALELCAFRCNTSLTIKTSTRANSSAKFHMKFSGVTSDERTTLGIYCLR